MKNLISTLDKINRKPCPLISSEKKNWGDFLDIMSEEWISCPV